MDTTPQVMEIVDRAYNAAADEGKPKVLVIPTTPILLPVDPVNVSKTFPFYQQLAVGTVADALVEVYSHPTAEVIRRYARDLAVIADALEDAPTSTEVH